MKVAAALGAVLLPALAQAAAPVQTGEHPGFTRISIVFAATPGWTVVPVEGGWEFHTAGEAPGFDLSRAYARVGTERMAELRAVNAGVLRIVSHCDCHVAPWVFRGRIPVIDIYDGPPAPGTDPSAPILPSATAPDLVGPEPPTPVAAPVAAGEGPPVETTAPDAADLAAAIDRATRPAILPQEQIRAEADHAAQERAQELEQKLAAALGRAGSQGILEPADPNAPPVVITPAPEAAPAPDDAGSTAPEAAGEPAPPDSLPPAAKSQVRVETAIDRDRRGARPERADLTAAGDSCPDPAQFDLDDWGALQEGKPDFAAWTSGLTGEFDQFRPDAVERAARFYLFLGMGAEAAQLLNQLPDSQQRARWLALAEILDHEGDAPVGAAVDGWESCDGPVALWSTLAGAPLAAGDPIALKAVVTAFMALPAHLKALLGPRLISAFTEAGHTETALQIRNALDLAPSGRTVDATIAEADLQRHLERPEKAAALLERGLQEIDPDSPEMLLQLARQLLSQGQGLSEQQFGALEAHAYQHRGQPIATELHQVLAQAEITAGRFTAAAQRLQGPLGGREPPELVRELYLAVADRADAATFLRLTQPEPAGLGITDADMPARTAIAARLVQLGFPGPALATLEPPDSGAAASPLPPDAELVAAQAELAQGRGAAVLVRLAARDDADALALLARAHESLGQVAKAERLYRAAGQTEDAQRLSHGREPAGVPAAGVDAASGDDAAEPASPREPDKPAPADPYAEAAQVIAASAAERAKIVQLLGPTDGAR